MRVVCRHGHFAFFPREKEDVIHFQRLFKLQLYKVDDYYTFLSLKDLPRWSQTARPFGNLPAVVTYEGRHAWDVMKANDFVYSLALKALVPRLSVVGLANLKPTLDCLVAPKPLVQPGLLTNVPGVALSGYEGMLDMKFQKLYVYSQETLP